MKFNIVFIVICLFTGKSVFSQQKKPNIVVVVVDQLRAQSTGYSGNKDVITPNLDRLASKSVNVKNAVSGMPVCTPYRASLLTGQYPTTHGVFMNDVMLDSNKLTIAKVYKNAGYSTGYIGKWHIDGHGRSSYIPPTRHQGFDYWKVLECTHDYNKSPYYEGDSKEKKMWEGYDAIAQAADAANYIKEHAKAKNPFMLFVSFGPPHDPYGTAPQKYKDLYKDREVSIPDNVPAAMKNKIAKDLKDYYSHISAIDDCVGNIWAQLKASGLEDNTILVFTSDHGDMMGGHGLRAKQKPYSESIKVPFLLHYPAKFRSGIKSDILLNSPDIMPTLLGLTGIPVPRTVEGFDFSRVLAGKEKDKVDATLISCVQPFGEWGRRAGGKEFRGVVTRQYTYVKDLNGPWLLFDNLKDPLQMNNLIRNNLYKGQQAILEKQLAEKLKKIGDEFKPGIEYVKKWNYVIDETGTVPYRKMNFEGKPVVE